jgi:hypothetical protein
MLQSLFYPGGDAALLGLYNMIVSGIAAGKISKIELIDLTGEEVKEATSVPMDSPTGEKLGLTLEPTKKLILVTETKGQNGSSMGTTNFITEGDERFLTPVPGPVSEVPAMF